MDTSDKHLEIYIFIVEHLVQNTVRSFNIFIIVVGFSEKGYTKLLICFQNLSNVVFVMLIHVSNGYNSKQFNIYGSHI